MEKDYNRYTSENVIKGSILMSFLILGISTSFGMVLLPKFKILFNLDYMHLMFCNSAFNITYLLFSYPAGIFLERHGYKKTLQAGLIIYSIGCLFIYPALRFHSFALILFGSFVTGIGFNLQMVAGNPFLISIGPPDTASSRVTLGHAFIAVGLTIGPIIGSLYILSELVKTNDEISNRIQTLNSIVAIIFMALFIVYYFIKPEKKGNVTHTQNDLLNDKPLQYKQLVFAFVGIFLYIGLEATVYSEFINFISDSKIANVSVSQAGIFLSVLFLGFMLARFGGVALQKKVRPNLLLAIFSIINICLVLCVILFHGMLVVWFLVLTGVFNSIMFPIMFAFGLSGLGKLEARGSGILILAFSGGAVVPVLQGALADLAGLQLSFFIIIPIYAYILFFGIKGYKPGKFVKQNKIKKVA